MRRLENASKRETWWLHDGSMAKWWIAREELEEDRKEEEFVSFRFLDLGLRRSTTHGSRNDTDNGTRIRLRRKKEKNIGVSAIMALHQRLEQPVIAFIVMDWPLSGRQMEVAFGLSCFPRGPPTVTSNDHYDAGDHTREYKRKAVLTRFQWSRACSAFLNSWTNKQE